MRRKAILTIRLHHGLLHMDDANMAQPIRSLLTALGALAAMIGVAGASDFSEPWKREDRALVIDAYEYNPIDWPELVSDKRIVGFINKASDGLAPAYYCSGDVVGTALVQDALAPPRGGAGTVPDAPHTGQGAWPEMGRLSSGASWQSARAGRTISSISPSPARTT